MPRRRRSSGSVMAAPGLAGWRRGRRAARRGRRRGGAKASAASGRSTPSSRAERRARGAGPSRRGRGCGRRSSAGRRRRRAGAVTSRSMIAPGPPVTASEWRTTAPSLARSTPAASARRSASPTAVNATKCSRLRASLARVPAPTGPRCATSPAQRSNGPRHVSTACGRAADHHGQVAARRAHRTRRSPARRRPRRRAASPWPASSTAVSGAMVEWMATTVPGRAAPKMPSSPATTSRTCVVVEHHHRDHLVRGPRPRRASTPPRAPLATTAFHGLGPRRRTPSARRASPAGGLAIGPPMLPRPMNPTPTGSGPARSSSSPSSPLTSGSPARRRR